MGLEVVLPRPALPTARRRWPSLLPLVLPIVILMLWQLSITVGWIEPYQLTPPLQVLESAVDHWNRGLLQSDILSTTYRVLVGFAVGAGLGVVLGTITGLSERAYEAVEPTLQAVRSIPTLAWAPLLLLWMGIGELPKFTLVAIGAFFPVYVNLVAGIKGVDRKLVEVARIYNLDARQTAMRVILPASLPSLFTGLRLGFSQGWLFVVIAEIFGATSGLGFRLTDSLQSTRVDLMLVALITLAVLGKVSDSILVAVERRALRWRDTIGTEVTA